MKLLLMSSTVTLDKQHGQGVIICQYNTDT